MSQYLLTEPCDACPFLTTNGFTFARLQEFADHGEFTCHKTCVPDDNGDFRARNNGKSLVCAGMLIFNEKREQPNQIMRIAERVRAYDRTKLNMSAPVGSKPSHYSRRRATKASTR